MSKLNITQFAKELGLPASLLLEQLNAAGIIKEQESDPVTEHDKSKLLDHLRSARSGSAKAKITPTRRKTTEIKKWDSADRALTIQVGVRKRQSAGAAA